MLVALNEGIYICLQESFNMLSGKLRPLPTWMAKKEEEKKASEEQHGGSRKRRAARTIYCMNEKELVEAAVAYLSHEDGGFPIDLQVKDEASDDKVRKGFRKTPAAKRTARDSTFAGHPPKVPEEPAYVSESDFDLTEAETVPYTTTNTSSPELAVHGANALQDQIGPVNTTGMGSNREAEHTHTPSPTADDDPLQLVREIFFT